MSYRLGRGKIDEIDLQQHLRTANRGGNSGYSNFSEEDQRLLYELGEAILAGNAANIKADGKLYNASGDVADGVAASVIAITGGNAGEYSMIEMADKIEAAGTGFTPDRDVWLVKPDGSGRNLSTDKPKAVAGNVIQRLGRAIDSDNYICEIGTAEPVI